MGRARHSSDSFNGATPFQAWRQQADKVKPKTNLQLQWGHAFSGVETTDCRDRCAPASARFNGATPFQAWRLEETKPWEQQPGEASMGPRLFRRGDLRGAEVHRLYRHRFNGATPFQAWRRRGVSTTSSRPSSFNGATPFQAWRPANRDPANDGEPGCFNGATPFQAWRLQNTENAERNQDGLQWGHAFSGVETALLRLAETIVSNASMGPRLFRRGDGSARGLRPQRRAAASMGPRLFRRGDVR